MIDYNCIHHKVCNYVGFVCESCDKCQFREHKVVDDDDEIVKISELMKAVDAHEEWIYDSNEGVVGYTPFQIEEAARACAKPAEETVGVCVEHEWAEEHEDKLISNFECPYCHEWHREGEVDTFCSHCGKKIMIVHKERRKR